MSDEISDADKREFLEVTFRFCLDKTLDNRELMDNYRRLTGSRIFARINRSPIERMVDAACGHDPFRPDEAELQHFFRFVRDAIWRPWLAIVEESARTRRK